MNLKNISQEHFNILKSGYHACTKGDTFTVGREYIIINPSNKDERIKARCTQDCPYALIKVEE